MAEVMNKPLQIATLKKIFHSLNPWGDEQDVDWEAYVDSKAELDANRAMLATVYPGFSWYPEEEVSPELAELRESKRTISELRKRIKDLEKIIPEEQINALKAELEKQRKIAEEKEREIIELRRRKPEEVVPAMYEELKRSVETLTERLHEMDIILTATLKRVKERPTPEITVIPRPEAEADTTIVLTPDEVAIGEEINALAKEKYGKTPLELTPEESAEVYNEAIRIVESAGKYVGRMPQIEDILKLVRDRKGRVLFPEDKFYWIRRSEFYPWWEDIPVKLYKLIEQDHIISREDLEMYGVPSKWINEQIATGKRIMQEHGLIRL